jgi:hypothetical protein
MKPDNPVLFIKIDKDITDYLKGGLPGRRPCCFSDCLG